MIIRRTGHSVAFHIDAIGESREFQVGGREGIWWLPNDTASDYLILTNQGGNTIPLDLALYDASGKKSTQRVLLGLRETTRYSVRKLVQAAHIPGSYGGIKISAASHAGSLNTLHFLFDETAGFSAILKMFDYDQNSKLEERDYAKTAVWTLRAPMLALSTPDPALAFPPNTTLHPQLFIRNATGKPIDAALRLNWRTANSTGKASGPAVRLAPYETRRIDVAALQSGTLPKEANWTSVTITTNSKPDELMAVAASYDGTLRYGAQTPFSDQLSFHSVGSLWEYDAQHNSLITVGNGGTKPLEAALIINYNEGTQKYELERSLQPDEQMWIDVGKLIREQVRDKNGNVLPPNLTSGSYELRDLTNKGVGQLFEGKIIYDKTYGHVTYGCAVCCGYAGNAFAWMEYDPLGILNGGTASDVILATDNCSGQDVDVTLAFQNNWSTGNPSIATVDAYGTHTGRSVGTTSSFTSGELESSNQAQQCPLRTVSPSGGDNVTPKVTIDSFAPDPIPQGGTANVHITITPSANIALAITSSGTGSATFGTSGQTTTQIPDTTTVNVTAGSLSSNGAADLTLSASYGGTQLATYLFSVTTGACSATYTGSVGSGLYQCPSDVTVQDNYSLAQFCGSCSFACIPVNYDATFTPSGCTPTTGGVQGAGNQGLTSTETGRFAPSDCNTHNLQIQTTITNAQGQKNNYTGGNIGLKCNANGSPVCH
jgi:hypothetical protein